MGHVTDDVARARSARCARRGGRLRTRGTAGDRHRRAEGGHVRRPALGAPRPPRRALRRALGRAARPPATGAARRLDGGRTRCRRARAARLRALSAIRAARADAARAAALRARVRALPRALPRRARLARVERGQPPVLPDRETAASRRALLRRRRPQLHRLPRRRRGRARRQRDVDMAAQVQAPRGHAPAHLGPPQLRRRQPLRLGRNARAAERHAAREGLVHRDRRPGAAARVRRDARDARVPLLAPARRARDPPRDRARPLEPAHQSASTCTTGGRRSL